MVFFVHDMILSWNGSSTGKVDFEVAGEPLASNGPRIRFRNLRVPIIFDPLAREKRQLRNVLKLALSEVGVQDLLFREMELKVNITFFMANRWSKDIDNMAKFILDAMNLAIYDDDQRIVILDLKKRSSTEPHTNISIQSV